MTPELIPCQSIFQKFYRMYQSLKNAAEKVAQCGLQYFRFILESRAVRLAALNEFKKIVQQSVRFISKMRG